MGVHDVGRVGAPHARDVGRELAHERQELILGDRRCGAGVDVVDDDTGGEQHTPRQ